MCDHDHVILSRLNGHVVFVDPCHASPESESTPSGSGRQVLGPSIHREGSFWQPELSTRATWFRSHRIPDGYLESPFDDTV